ncbi:NAD(P)/FAD-dependent oxidoreductase [Haloarcula nitratireducens]|uniref:FAD-dependent monooxygenase n=1 Tax=Haloarcula nitratireducens TaxID=2487749 RepID=A0AAW4PAR2_9EURY|nr:FAD-dependent monooxygenase [Halomicroarcula nitratireducens]MBX0295176.1 FAD-dependent monooxygenase [Halomicroarcula nitratireducens]
MTLATVPQYDGDRSTVVGDRAVVVGAGMAGLLAARVLADAFETVTVIERDSLPDGPRVRDGVPQARHVHVMLEAGRATLEDLFPGYRADLLSAGGLEIDGARDVSFYAEGGFLADGPESLPHYAATRPLYEWLVRRRLAEFDGVALRDDCQFAGYLTDERARNVTGIVVRNERRATEELDATLVVDATGRPSRTPAWLDAHGYAPPVTDEVHIDLAYSTTFVERPPGDERALIVTPAASQPRAAGVLPVEDGRWVVTLGGMHGEHPPTDAEGFAAFAASLPVPDVATLLDDHAWVSEDIAHYPFPANRRYRYEALDRFPEGLLVVGDGVASFNPLYGQGMSVAALEALLLHDALAADGIETLAPRFFERGEEVVDVAWGMAVGADFQFPETTGPRPRGTGLLNRYVARLNRKAQTDGVLRNAFVRVMMMERPPSSLFRPGIMWRVLV